MRTLALIVSLGISFTLGVPTSAMADTVQLRDDAPDRHVVVKGDTLWDISAKFLKSPWLWPELWQINNDRIKNPHLIYPGDTVLLVMTPEGPRLARMETVKLSPSIHAEAIVARDAIPTIPYATVKSFLRRPLLDSAEALAHAPKLIGTEDGRNLVSLGDRAYADAITGDTAKWNIVRLGKPLKDPATGVELAREVEFVGDAKTRVNGSPATLEIVEAEREVMLGDRLVPATEANALDFMPHAPAKAVAGRIISAFGSSQTSGRYSTVIINKGRADGLEPGHVLAVSHPGKTLGRAKGEDRTDSFAPKAGYIDARKERLGAFNSEEVANLDTPADDQRRWLYLGNKCLKADATVTPNRSFDPAKVMEECQGNASERMNTYLEIGCLKPGKQVTYGEPFNPKDVYLFDLHCRATLDASIRLPDVRAGLIMVYQVFDQVSYALVMESTRPLYLLDTVANP